MTRKEEIWQQAGLHSLPWDDAEEQSQCEDIFVKGAKWADKTMIDNAVKWLYDHLATEYQGAVLKIVVKEKGLMPVEFVEKFKKAMEE